MIKEEIKALGSQSFLFCFVCFFFKFNLALMWFFPYCASEEHAFLVLLGPDISAACSIQFPVPLKR